MSVNLDYPVEPKHKSLDPNGFGMEIKFRPGIAGHYSKSYKFSCLSLEFKLLILSIGPNLEFILFYFL